MVPERAGRREGGRRPSGDMAEGAREGGWGLVSSREEGGRGEGRGDTIMRSRVFVPVVKGA